MASRGDHRSRADTPTLFGHGGPAPKRATSHSIFETHAVPSVEVRSTVASTIPQRSVSAWDRVAHVGVRVITWERATLWALCIKRRVVTRFRVVNLALAVTGWARYLSFGHSVSFLALRFGDGGLPERSHGKFWNHPGDRRFLSVHKKKRQNLSSGSPGPSAWRHVVKRALGDAYPTSDPHVPHLLCSRSCPYTAQPSPWCVAHATFSY